VTGGNVSFYNESSDGAVFPTPTIGLVGLLEKADTYLATAPRSLDKAPYSLLLLGEFRPSFGGSEYLAHFKKQELGEVPFISLEAEKKAIELLLDLHGKNLLISAKDLSLGGLLVALAKMQMARGGLIQIQLDNLAKAKGLEGNLHKLCFGETGSSFLVTCLGEKEPALKTLCDQAGLSCFSLGTYQSGDGLHLSYQGKTREWTGDQLEDAFSKPLQRVFL